MTSARSFEPIRLPAHNPGLMTGPGNNTWLLDGAEPTLVDAGVGHPDHLDDIARHLEGRALARVIVTHAHGDHIGGVPALRARWPTLDVCRFVDGDHTGIHPLRDGQSIRAGDIDLRVVHTPGHAPDHICLFDMPRGFLYAGDMILAGTTVVIPAARGGDLRAYLDSLATLAALHATRIYPGHGEVIDDPNAAIEAYLLHRRRREKQILGYIAKGLTTAEAIVDRAYPHLPDAMKPAARDTVEAHLRKLRDEGRLG